MTTNDVTSHEETRRSPRDASIILAVLVASLAAYIMLAAALGVTVFAGSLVLFFWAGISRLKLKALPAVVVGSLGGILNGALFALLPSLMNAGVGLLLALLVLVVALYLLLVGWLPLLFNQPYMLLLTVTLIPSVLASRQFIQMGESVIYGGMFWGGLVLVGVRVRAWRSNRPFSKRSPG